MKVSIIPLIIKKLRKTIGVVVTGNTAEQNVSAGEYVLLTGSTISGKPDGLYKAANNVSSGTAFTASDLTEVSGGLGREVKALFDLVGTKQNATDNSLTTTSKTVTGAINEHESDITSLNSKVIPQLVSSVPYQSGIFYCNTEQTICGVTIPAYAMYDIHVYNHDATGKIVHVNTGRAWSISGVQDAFSSCEQLVLNSSIRSGTLPNNTDLNTVDTVGEYLLSANYTYTNKPYNEGNFLKISRSSETASTVLQTVYSAGGNIYTRFRTTSDVNSWTAWSSSSFNYVDTSNKTVYSFNAVNRVSTRYWIALMYISAGVSTFGLYSIFISTDGTVTVNKLVGGSTITFTGSLSNGVITLTASSTVYGGIRVIMPN